MCFPRPCHPLPRKCSSFRSMGFVSVIIVSGLFLLRLPFVEEARLQLELGRQRSPLRGRSAGGHRVRGPRRGDRDNPDARGIRCPRAPRPPFGGLDQHFRPNGGCFLGAPPPLHDPRSGTRNQGRSRPSWCACAPPYLRLWCTRDPRQRLWGRRRVV